ncbi:MAG TPA: F0F1 ATP synthase subunit delta [Candidatus Saccharimonadales bacterium]|jgi:ATP synthase F1 delta subunit|nr:F0F1 ATP synthase subunit delta [Candidatus Saccharimonadales bacterium]
MNNKVSRRVIARTVAAKLLAEPSKQSYWLKVTAAYLLEQNMASDVDLVINDIAHELFEQSGHLLVDVTSAHKLSEQVRDELKHTMRKATGAQRVELTEHINPDLLGGLIARTSDAELDASVRTKLKQLASL